MNEITTIGVDLAKSVFQLHGIDVAGKTVLRRQLRRSQMLEFFQKLPACLVGMEACASAHYWARELIKLGHEVRLNRVMTGCGKSSSAPSPNRPQSHGPVAWPGRSMRF